MEAITHEKVNLNTIPNQDMVNHLRSLDYLVIPANGKVHEDEDLIDALDCEDCKIIGSMEMHEDLVNHGQAKVRLTGSMVDTEVEEIIAELHTKHGFNLANVLRTLC